MLEMMKSMDRMADEMREIHSYKRREEFGTSDGSVMKLKGKDERDGYHSREIQQMRIEVSIKNWKCQCLRGKILSPGLIEQNTSSRLIIY